MELWDKTINPLNAELNFICHLLTLLGAHHILQVSRIRVNCNVGSHGKEHNRRTQIDMSLLYSC